MTKDNEGIWSVTLGPVAPDIYPYAFVVDGVTVMDNNNPFYFENERFKASMVDITGDTPLIHAIREVPHGTVNYDYYDSEVLGTTGRLVVYTPPGYDAAPDRRYPVFYLISGTTDTEETYFKVGRANFILDNLIAQGLAQEMIVVMPYGNPAAYFAPDDPRGNEAGNRLNEDFLQVMMPYVEANYRTINDAEQRAIGGFSRGGNQGLTIGMNHLDKFSYLCSYASFAGNVVDFETSFSRFIQNPAQTNKRIHLFWLGLGTEDFLYEPAKLFMDKLEKNGIATQTMITGGGHTWMNAKLYLAESAKLLFQPQEETQKEQLMENATLPEQKKEPAEENPEIMAGVRAVVMQEYPVSPEVHANRSATFRFHAPEATNVELNAQFLSENLPMTKDEKGLWSVTTSPIAPDLYPYCFVVDGVSVADPNNPMIFPNERFKNSLADIPGVQPSIYAMQQVPRGRINYRFYASKTLQDTRPLVVYTPPGYDPLGQRKYPVLYLIHGATDTHETWFKVGRIHSILDNLIAAGKAEPMIVVMPYANPNLTYAGKPNTAISSPFNYSEELIGEVIPYVEQHYAVQAEPSARAVAGFSRGGSQTLQIGLGHPEIFHYVCPLAPAVNEERIAEYFGNGTYASPELLKNNLRLLWLGCGTDDFLYEGSLSFARKMEELGVPHEKMYPPGGHTWMNCRLFFHEITQKLFK